MGEEWGHFINIENNNTTTAQEMNISIHYKDQDDEYNFNNYDYENYGCKDYNNDNENYSYILCKIPDIKTKNDSFNKKRRILTFAYILFSICNFGRCVVESCKSFASFVSFTSNNANS
jgi:hypothetical protein